MRQPLKLDCPWAGVACLESGIFETMLGLNVLLAAAVAAAPPPSPDPFDWSGPPGSSKSFVAATSDGGLLLTWFEPRPDKRFALMIAERSGGRWGSPKTVTESGQFFVNWADFPSVVQSSSGIWAVHWLEKTAAKAYAYHVRLSTSMDRGKTWSSPVTVHRDSTPTEHGFVAMVPGSDGSVQITWLDGRAMTDPAGSMSVRTTSWLPNGTLSAETVLDTRSCECCQVSMAKAAGGLVVAYRDRSPEEVRDIAVVRQTGGTWSEPAMVARDNWVWKACPVNGPSIGAFGQDVAVAWFTAAGGQNTVKYALSADGGARFGAPVRLDLGGTLGRVHLQMVGPAQSLVTWLEAKGDKATWYVRRVEGRSPGRPIEVGTAGRARDGGFPRTAVAGKDLFITWTEPGPNPAQSRVRVRRFSIDKVK